MTEVTRFRRVVTGLNAEGKSCILVDGPITRDDPNIGVAWHTGAVPADNSAVPPVREPPFSHDLMQHGGSVFMVTETPPGTGVGEPFWHATDTVDYAVILQGEIVLALETGEARLKAGDFLVDRGVIHAWYNDGPEPAVMAIAVIPAYPVGPGRTI